MRKISPVLGLALGSVAALTLSASAHAENVLYSFGKGGGGNTPVSHILFSKGALYGTTEKGGQFLFGTVFKLSPIGGVWQETVLYTFFGGADGAYPKSGLIMDKSGNLYGTTQRGGQADKGIVFRLSPSNGGWTKENIHGFLGGNDGANPIADLHRDPTTNHLYGTTYAGGTSNCGVVYEMALSGGVWHETVVYDLGGSAGCQPISSLRQDSVGNVYGTTTTGGQYGYGAVFTLISNGNSWTENTIYAFGQNGGADGHYGAGIDISPSGILYGATSAGGTHTDGTIFELVPSGGNTWKETVIHDFAGGTDGINPSTVRLDTNNNVLYGTTLTGGTNNDGTLFSLQQVGNSWSESVLHDFTGKPDGTFPEAGVSIDFNTNNVYGTTSQGGNSNLGSVYLQVP